jgi:glycerol-3-phosphate dehydrogenase (NAD(P)+)
LEVKNITILGAGRIGHALGSIVSKKNISVQLWDKDPSKVPGQKKLEEIIPPTDLIFLCTPSWGIREAIESIKPHLALNTGIVSFTKGIEKDTGKIMDELLAEILPSGQKFALVSGPMMAEELEKGITGRGVVASKDPEIFKALSKIFNQTALCFEWSEDLRGVAISGVLKNIYSLALGMSDGLNYSVNTKGWLSSLALREMIKISSYFGGQTDTILGTAGLADLLATGWSKYSRNRTCGEEMTKTGQLRECEGVISISLMKDLLDNKIEGLPLFKALCQVIIGQANAKDTLNDFVCRA